MVERLKSTRKNIMREFTISELSAVDRPAQAHARMSLMKRYSSDEQEHNMQFEKITERPRSFNTLQEAMAAIQEHEKCAAHEAMSKAARENPALVEKYNAEGERQVTKALERMQSPTEAPSVAEFKRLVDAIVARDMCPRTTALRRARAENPEAFARYQEA